jgi:hypothetical protein
MGFDAGCNFSCGGSWEAPSEAHPAGRLIAGNGLVTAKRVLIGPEPVVRLTLAVAVAPENVAWEITERADYPVPGTWCISPVDNANYDVKFLPQNGEALVDQSFDFTAVKFGQPQQGLGK